MLRDLISKAGIKQNEVADVMGITESRLSAILRNEEALTDEQTNKIRDAINELTTEKAIFEDETAKETRVTQLDRVIDYINKHKVITPMDAFHYLGITKLATVVSNGRRKGIPFIKEWGKGVNRYGKACEFMTYRLEPEQTEQQEQVRN